MASSTVVDIDLKGLLPKVASGKVRDLFAIDDDTLLFVASDRISAYDVVMQNVRSQIPILSHIIFFLTFLQGIPGKGALLTGMR